MITIVIFISALKGSKKRVFLAGLAARAGTVRTNILTVPATGSYPHTKGINSDNLIPRYI